MRDLVSRQRARAGGGALLWMSHQTCEALVPVAIGLSIDHAVATSDVRALVIAVLAILALFAVLTTSWRNGMWFIAKAVLAESHRLRVAIVRRLLSGSGLHTKRQGGEILSIATSDTLAAAELFEVAGWAAAASVGLVVSAVVLIRIDWVLGLGILILVPVLILGLQALSPLVERRTAGQQQAVGLAAGLAGDLLTGLRPLRGFGGVPEAARRYRTASQVSLRASVGALQASAVFLGATTFATGLLLTVVAGVAGSFALSGRLTIGELITVVGLAAFLIDPVLHLARSVMTFATVRASASRVAELLDAPVRGTGGELAVEATGASVSLRSLAVPGLPELELAVEPGETLGVVATTVAAADSLTQLFAGTLTPVAGELRVAGVPLGDYRIGDLRRILLVEPHRVDLFGTTLREALGTGERELDDTQLRVALAAAGAADLAEDLDRDLLEHGVDLSGGQRQRVALARALLADRPITVFRDPTTAVDAVTENAMAEGIVAFRGGRATTIMITSSPPLLAACDRVAQLGERQVRIGTHDELLRHADYAEAVLR